MATIDRMIVRLQHRLAADPGQNLREYLRAELIALQWAKQILLEDHALPLKEAIRLHQHPAKLRA